MLQVTICQLLSVRPRTAGSAGQQQPQGREEKFELFKQSEDSLRKKRKINFKFLIKSL